MTIIDFHNHFYPPEYLEAVKAGPSSINVTFDDDNNPLLHYPGDYNIVVPGHRDVDFRADILDKAGVDMQVLTMTTPGTHVETPERAAELAKIVNDSFAGIMKTHGKEPMLNTGSMDFRSSATSTVRNSPTDSSGPSTKKHRI